MIFFQQHYKSCPTKEHTCRECGKSYRYAKQYEKHICVSCDKCEKTFVRQFQLVRHKCRADENLHSDFWKEAGKDKIFVCIYFTNSTKFSCFKNDILYSFTYCSTFETFL